MQSCHVILASIRKVLEADGILPPNLYLQADNCWKENKNRYVFALLALLVHNSVFETIELGFLLVGHTHDDIDQ